MRPLCVWLAAVFLCTAPRAYGQGFTQGGISGAYFANATLSGTPAFTRNDTRIRFAWAGAPPGGSTTPAFAAVPATGFSVRWTGTLVADVSGVFSFSATTSGPARLWLTPPGGNATGVISSSGTATGTHSGKITLVAGQPYAVRFEFQDTASPAVARLDCKRQPRATLLLSGSFCFCHLEVPR